LFQLTEERVHLCPRRLSSVAYLRHLVEPAIGFLKHLPKVLKKS
jgi:hypothetical protein